MKVRCIVSRNNVVRQQKLYFWFLWLTTREIVVTPPEEENEIRKIPFWDALMLKKEESSPKNWEVVLESV